MGYTHYWQSPLKKFSDKEWSKLSYNLRFLVSMGHKSGIRVAEEYDMPESPPYFGDFNIAFNGVGEAGHETFWIDRAGKGFSFCKTAHKPYDTLVVACLIYLSAKHGFKVSSDGDESDWQEGLNLARKVFPDLKLEIPAFAD